MNEPAERTSSIRPIPLGIVALADLTFLLVGPACFLLYFVNWLAGRNDMDDLVRLPSIYQTFLLIHLLFLPLTGSFLFIRHLGTQRPFLGARVVMASLIGSFLLLAVMYVPLAWDCGIHYYTLRDQHAERMRWEVDRAQLARACLGLIEALKKQGGKGYSLYPLQPSPFYPEPKHPAEYAALPEVIRFLRPIDVSVEKDRVFIGLTGGFSHYSFLFEKNEKEHVWVLEFSGEGGGEILYQLPIQPEQVEATK
jgi:hypothetical protein